MTVAVSTQTLDMSVKAEVLGGTWETFGVDRVVQVLPESLVCSANEWGPDKASFVLRRSPWAAWPDLQPYTPVEIEIGGVKVWEGRTNGTPLKAGAEQQVSVQCEGWQYHLDDNLYQRTYVHASLTDFRDSRSFPGVSLSTYLASGTVEASQGQLVFSYPKGSVAAHGACLGATIDLGETAAGAVAIAINTELTGVTGGLFKFYAIAHNGFNVGELWGEREDFSAISNAEMVTGSYYGTVASPRRYVSLLVYREGAEETRPSDLTFALTAVSIFTGGFHTGAGVSTLKATEVAVDALERATTFISRDHSQVNTASDLLALVALVMLNGRSAREMIETVNALHDWTTKLDLARRLVFAPRPSAPQLEIGSWSGEEIEDTSAGEGSEIFDSVTVEGIEANGTPLSVTVTRTGSVVSERGFPRSKALPVQNVLTKALGEKLGAVWLDSHQETPFAGSVKATVGSVRQVLSGQPVHPSLLLRDSQELIRVSHMIDPTNGGVGRDGLIAGVTYTHADQAAEIALNTRLDNFDPLLERLAALESVGS